MKIKKFLQEDDGAIAMEYVILVAAAAMLLIVGAWTLFGALSDEFTKWADYFKGAT